MRIIVDREKDNYIFFINNIKDKNLFYIMNNNYINYILSLSNLLGFLSFNISIKKNSFIALYILLIMSTSALHHLTETNQMGHSLDGVDFCGLKK